MHRTTWSTVAAIILVLAMGVAGRWVAASAWDSVVNYHSPYNFHAQLEAGPRLVDRVVLVTFDGLRLDLSRQLPVLNQLRARGVDGVARVGTPSLSNPGRAVMATGAWANINGITSNFGPHEVVVDSIFSRAHQAGLRTVAAGIKFWSVGFGRYLDVTMPWPEEPKNKSAAELLQLARTNCSSQLQFIRNTNFNLLVFDAGFGFGDDAAHDFGPLSPGAREVYQELDSCLGQALGFLDLTKTTVIATADHGHVTKGGHGGDEPDVMTVPLVLAGGPVRITKTQIKALQINIAPTICALLGVALPSTNEGKILTDALVLDASRAIELKRIETQQQNYFTGLRAQVLGHRSNPLSSAMRAARRYRLPVALAIGAGLLVALIWLFGGLLGPGERAPVAGAMAGFYVIYYALFDLRGLGYSLTAVNKEEYLGSFFRDDMLIAGAALVIVCFLLGFVFAARGFTSIRLAAAATLLVSLSVAGTIDSAYWAEGFWMRPWLPDFRLLFRVYLDLLILFGFCFAIWPAMAACWLGARLRPERAG